MYLFTNPQLKRLSNILDNAGQVVLGSLVLAPLMGSEGSITLIGVASLGSFLVILLWGLSLSLERPVL